MEQVCDISVVTVNYNGLDDTVGLIESLLRHIRSVAFEIVVVDNGSREDEAAVLRERFPEIKVVRSEKNLGFAGGNNLGIREAVGRYIFLLNNDTFVLEDNFGELVAAMDAHPEIGALSPKIKYADSGQAIQFAGASPLSPVTLRNRAIGCGEPDRGQYDTACPIPYTHGAAMLVRREVAERTGGMPEQFFLYYEELDWCAAIGRLGYEMWYYPCATIYHKESRSTGQSSPLKQYYMTRNRLLYAWRNLPFPRNWLSIGYQLAVAVPKNYLAALAHGRRDLASATRRGAGAFFTMKGKRDDVR